MSDAWDINENTDTPSHRPEHDRERRRLDDETGESSSDESAGED